MITQIKKRGASLTIVLPTEFVRYMEFKEYDWVDISEISKVGKNETH